MKDADLDQYMTAILGNIFPQEMTIYLLQRIVTIMSDTDDRIAALRTDVAALQTTDASAIALIQGLSAQLSAALASAAAAGATPEQLQALSDLDAAIKDQNTQLAGAVTVGTPTPQVGVSSSLSDVSSSLADVSSSLSSVASTVSDVSTSLPPVTVETDGTAPVTSDPT